MDSGFRRNDDKGVQREGPLPGELGVSPRFSYVPRSTGD